MEDEFPGNRQFCIVGPRPCPWLRCREHMFWIRENLQPRKAGGDNCESILKKYNDSEIVDMIFSWPETCSLDVIGKGPHTLETVGNVLGVTRERIRQIESGNRGSAIHKMKGINRARILRDFYIDSD